MGCQKSSPSGCHLSERGMKKPSSGSSSPNDSYKTTNSSSNSSHYRQADMNEMLHHAPIEPIRRMAQTIVFHTEENRRLTVGAFEEDFGRSVSINDAHQVTGSPVKSGEKLGFGIEDRTESMFEDLTQRSEYRDKKSLQRSHRHMKLDAKLQSAQTTRRPNVRQLVMDRSDCYVGYQDYGLDQIVKPETLKQSNDQLALGSLDEKITADLFDFKPILAGRDAAEEESHKLSKMYLVNNDSLIRMATISGEGKAQIRNRNLESFTLEMMVVTKIIFGGSDWLGFLGHHKVTQNGSNNRTKSKTQFLEIFSQ